MVTYTKPQQRKKEESEQKIILSLLIFDFKENKL